MENFKGHIILYCKNHYKLNEKESFIDGFERIWAFRHLLDYNKGSRSSLDSVANYLYQIINEYVEKEQLVYFYRGLHKEIAKCNKDEYYYSPIEVVILYYASWISDITIEKNGQVLIKLPKPQKRVFNKILNNIATMDDYRKILK